MALESATYISDLVSTNPTSSDNLSQGDDHLRLLKSTIKATFPNVSGAVTATHTELNVLDGLTASQAELNFVDGVTSSIQTQLNAKAPLASPTLTGVPAAPTAAVDTNTTQLATTAYVVSQGYLKSATASSTYLTSATAASTYLPIAGTAAQAAKLSTTSGAWLGAQDSVVGMIGWKAFGNNHVVFDASAGTSPNGVTVDTTNAGTAWTSGYPNLMGWNGVSTYGLRVDSARVADSVPASVVLNATAAAAISAVGTYAFLRFETLQAASAGTNHAGSGLRYTNGNGGGAGVMVGGGTWKLMGETGTGTNAASASLFLRIS